MNRILISIIIFLSGCSNINESNITGLYNLQIIEYQDSTNAWEQANWMKGGTGILHYDHHKNMSVHFIPKNYGENDSLKSYWYVGEYLINIDSNYIQHTRLLHSDPTEIGKKVKRYYELKNDTLIMFAKEFGFRLKWIKLNE